MTMLRVGIVAFLLLTAVAVTASPAAAIPPPVGGCGASTVEVCWIVCVTEPCHSYVCIHLPGGAGDICHPL